MNKTKQESIKRFCRGYCKDADTETWSQTDKYKTVNRCRTCDVLWTKYNLFCPCCKRRLKTR